MLLEAQQHHFSAFVVKDHYCPTMLSAYIAEKYVGDGSCRVFGGIALNNSVGGINLKAVDAAVAMGAKLVWMPTVSALRHKIMHSGKGMAFPASKGMIVAEKPIMYLQEDGSLQPQVLEVLDYLAAHPDVILATGHGSRDEIDALIHAAVERGVQRILVNHPHYMIGASLEVLGSRHHGRVVTEQQAADDGHQHDRKEVGAASGFLGFSHKVRYTCSRSLRTAPVCRCAGRVRAGGRSRRPAPA